MNTRDKIIKLRNYCVELGSLMAANQAIGYTVFLNEKGETLLDRIHLLREKIDELQGDLLMLLEKGVK